jgi:Ca2+-binding EF-hand superfamily protein
VNFQQYRQVILSVSNNLGEDELEYLFNSYKKDSDDTDILIADIIESLQSEEMDVVKFMAIIKKKLKDEKISLLELFIRLNLHNNVLLNYQEFERILKSIDATLLEENMILAFRCLRIEPDDPNSKVKTNDIKHLLHGKVEEELKEIFDSFLQKIYDCKVAVPEVVQSLGIDFRNEFLFYNDFIRFVLAIDATVRAEKILLLFYHTVSAHCEDKELRQSFEKIPMALFLKIFVGDVQSYIEGVLERLRSRIHRNKISINEIFLQLKIVTKGMIEFDRFSEVVNRIDFGMRREEIALLFTRYTRFDREKINAELFITEVNACQDEVKLLLLEIKDKIVKSAISVLEHLLVCGIRKFKQETIGLEKFAEFIKLVDNCCRREQIVLLFEHFEPDFDRKIRVKDLVKTFQVNPKEIDDLVDEIRRMIKENDVSLLELLLKLRIEFRGESNLLNF